MPDHPHAHLDALVRDARSRGSIAVAVAYPCDASSLHAARAAAHADLVRPLLGAELGERKSPLEFDPRWTDSP
jgi:hypothetical protein